MRVQETETGVAGGAEEIYFDRVGGHALFVDLIDGFFAAMADFPDLLAMYPAGDMDGARARLLMFFEEYWGGPTVYSRTRGAPMLKMRHMPYKITERAALEWMTCMHRAIDGLDLAADDEFMLRAYVERGAQYLINAD